MEGGLVPIAQLIHAKTHVLMALLLQVSHPTLLLRGFREGIVEMDDGLLIAIRCLVVLLARVCLVTLILEVLYILQLLFR